MFNFRAWLRSFFGRSPRASRGTPYRRQRSWRPIFDVLEDRVVPAGLQPNPTIFQPNVSAATPVNTEGQSVLANQVLLEFADSAGAVALTHLTATITWGDGSANTTATSATTSTADIVDTGTVDGSGNELFQVVALSSGPHVYEEASAGTKYNVSVADDGSAAVGGPGPTTGASTPLNGGSGVADPQITNLTAAGALPAQNEGQTPASPVLLAVFDDPGNPSGTIESASEYLVTINWGDGTTVNNASGLVSYNSVSGHFEVRASHTYFGEGSFNVNVSVTHENNTTTAAVLDTVAVNDPQVVTQTGTNSGSVNENATLTISNTQLGYTEDGNTLTSAAAGEVNYKITAVPTGGVLKNNGTTLAVGGTFTQADVNSGKITYTQNGGDANDSFGFTVQDDAGPTTTATFSITVNDPQVVTNVNNTGATAAENQTITLTNAQLAYNEDGNLSTSAAATEIIYTVKAVPTGGLLKLSGTTLVAGNTFTQDDINTGKVTYVQGGSDATPDGFQFTVQDDATGTPTATQTFSITITDPQAVTLVNNTGATANESQTITLTTAQLAYSEDGNGPTSTSATEIVYTVKAVPANGSLKLSGTALAVGGTFTQDDINSGRVTYTQNGNDATSDSFQFTVQDDTGTATATQTFNITLVDPQVVTKVNNTGATANENQTITITTAQLAYSEDGNGPTSTSATEIIYTVTALPTGGTLKLNGTAVVVGTTFTQADINAGNLTYVQGGSDATSDSFQFTVKDDVTGTATAAQTFTITIADPQVVTKVNNTGASVAENQSITLTNAELAYNEDGNLSTSAAATEIIYTVKAVPSGGLLKLSGTTLAVGSTFTQDDINTGKVTYVQTGTDATPDTFQFTVQDDATGTPTATQTFSIAITDPQVVTLVNNTGATANENQTITLTTAQLAYSEDGNGPTSTSAAEIVYTVKAVPANGTLKLSGTALAVGGTFTQDDINSGRVTYTQNGNDATSDSFQFTVQDDTGTATATQTFNLTLVDPQVVTLVNNTGATANENQTITLTTAELAYSEDGNGPTSTSATEIIYTVTALPTGGTLKLNGTAVVVGTTFTQADINAGNLTYVQGGGDATSDSFQFTVKDDVTGTATAAQTFTITIVDPQVVTKVNNTGATANENQTITLTTAQLAYSEDGNGPTSTSATEIIYTVKALPANGTLKLSATALSVGSTFTQDDINSGRVTYTQNGNDATNDSFQFTVQDDATGTPTATQTFAITIVDPQVVTQVNNTGATANENQTITLTTAQLAYSEDGNGPTSTSAAEIIYTVKAVPANGTLKLSGTALAVGNTFTQDDINSGRVTYTQNGTDATSDSFQFTVQDDTGTPTATQTFNITLVDPQVVTLVNNNSLSLTENSTAPITTADLAWSDDGGSVTGPGAGETIYTVTALPGGGTLLLNGSPIAVNGTFTQADINAGHLTYAATEETNVGFSYKVQDDTGPQTATQTFNITVTDPAVVAKVGPNINAVENGSTSLIILATFTDPAGAEALTEYDATVNWGDSSPADNTTDAAPNVFIVQPNPARNLYVVEGIHTYAEEGSYTITTTIHHHSEVAPNPVDTVVNTQTAIVADQQLANVASANLPASSQENVAVPAISGIATFTDPAGAEAIGDYTATINWGDGLTSTGTVVSTGSGTFRVDAPSHTYVEEGTYTVNVTLKHDNLASVTSPNQTITVAERAVTVTAATTTFTATEGILSAVQPVATFTDPAGPEAISEYSALINWGDGTAATAGTITVSGSTFTVSGAHAYAEEGAQNVTVTVVHNGTSADDSASPLAVTVTETAVAATGGYTVSAVEGTVPAAQTVATFTDPGGPEAISEYSATVTWGNGTTSAGTITYNAGVFTVSATPTATAVAEEGSSAFSVAINHPTGTLSATVAGTLAVADPAITGTGVAVTATEGLALTGVTVATFTDPGTPAGEPLGDYSATIDWGDGTAASAGAISLSSGTFTVTGGHTYAEEGSYTVKVTVHHDSSPATVITTNATVSDPAVTFVTPATQPTFTAAEGQLSALQPVAQFTDAGGNEVPGEYAAMISWGDGNSSPGVVALSGGVYTVWGAHAYAEESAAEHAGSTPYQISVTVTHGSAPSSTTTTAQAAQATVSEPAVALTGGFTLSGKENVSTTGLLATFTDPGGAEAAGDYSADINWGSGFVAGAGTVTFDTASQTFHVTGTNTFSEEGSFPIQVRVNHEGTSVTTSSVAVIADQAVSGVPVNVTAAEGQAFSGVTVATFTDPAGAEALGDYSATIDWGDGTAPSSGTISVSSGTFTVAGGHTYAEDGSFSIKVTLNHDTAPSVVLTAVAAVSDQQLTSLTDAGTIPTGKVEGQQIGAISGIATFVDPAGRGNENAGDFTASIDWGDGTTGAGTVVYVSTDSAGAHYQVNAPSHVYAEDGGYTIKVTVAHDQLAPVGPSTGQTITIGEAPISTPIVTTVTAGEGAAAAPITGIATFVDASGAATATDTFSATINWGDGSAIDTNATVVSLGGGNYRVDATVGHSYAEEGSYTITVAVTHDSLGAVSGTGKAVVTDAQLTNLALGTALANGQEGVQTTPKSAIATFTDPAGVGKETPAGDFTATIVWGDGTTSPGVVQSLGSGNYQINDATGHLYVEEGTYQVQIMVQHDGLGTLVFPTQTVTIVDQPITAVTDISTNVPTNLLEGHPTGTIANIANFTDPAGQGKETTGDFTAVILWGDGKQSAGQVLSAGSGSYQVNAPSHVYTEDGTFTIKVQVMHDGMSAVTSTGQTIVIGEAPISTPIVAPVSAAEGTPTGTITGIATFVDSAGVTDPADVFSATINWGDGSAVATGTVVSLGGGNYRVDAPSHTFTEEGTSAITVTVTHDSLTAVSGTGKATISDVQLTGLTLGTPLAGGQEGTATAPTANIATFTDPAGFGKETASGDFTATINWGDGTSSAAQVVATATAGVYQINDTTGHLYAEEGSYQVTIQVQHDGLAALTFPTQTVTITDPAVTTVTDGGTIPTGKLEGQAIGSISSIATFSDPAGQGKENAGDFTTTILWGDGKTSAGTVIMLGGGNYQVNAPSHTYAEDGTYTIQVQVSHDGTAPATSTGRTITIGEASISTPVVAPVSAAEGTPTGTITGIATFVDSAGVVAAGDTFSATINWGDGSATDTGTVVSLGGGNYRVDAPSHTFVEDGTSTITVAVTHDSLAAVSGTGKATISDVQLTGLTLAAPLAGGQEGTATTPTANIATFTDPAGFGKETASGDFTATINWGDGTTSAAQVVATATGGVYQINDTTGHLYAEEGSYQVTIRIQHDGLATLSFPTQTVTITDPAVTTVTDGGTIPTGKLEGQATGSITGIATFKDPAGQGKENAGDFSATILWGDGTSEPGTVVMLGGGNYQVNAPSHIYAEEGTYTIQVQVSHDGTAPATSTGQSITIGEAAISTPIVAPVSAAEGTPTGTITGIATFVDSAGVVAAGDTFSATINWGDGSATDTGTVVSIGGGHYRVDAPSHTFVEDGTSTITVAVTHDSLAPVSGTGKATISDVQLTNLTLANPLAGGQEGTPTPPAGPIAFFTDPAGFGNESPFGDFTATINWGDGTTSAALVTPTATPGVYQIIDTTGHPYVEDGSYQVTIHVQHDGLGTLAFPTQTVTITDPPVATVTDAGTLPTGKLEGQAIGSITGIATFSDPAGQGKENAGDFSATILWGDGTSASGTVVMLGNGNYQVNAPSHRYAEDGSYTIQVQVSHDGTAPATSTGRSITIGEAPISTPVVVAVSATQGNSTNAITGLASFVDSAGVVAPGDTFTATINWGDGSPIDTTATVVSLSGGHYRVDAPNGHTYSQPGTFTITVSVTHDSLAPVSGTAKATVTDAQVGNLVLGTPLAGGAEGTTTSPTAAIATFSVPGSTASEPVSNFKATISWGDGTSSAAQVQSLGGGNYQINDTTGHRYVEDGTYTATIYIEHDNLAVVSYPSQTITITDPPVTTVTDAGTIPTGKVEGQAIGSITGIATFSDPAGQGKENAGDFSATILWGDGTSGPGTVVMLGGGNYQVNAPSHTYAEDGSYTIQVQVSHDGTAPATSTGRSIIIGEAPISTPIVAAVSATEGTAIGTITGLATFTDTAGTAAAGDVFSATINWGDGSATDTGTVVALGGGHYRVDAPSHTFTEDGTSTITVSVTHDSLAAVSGVGKATISDVQLTGLTLGTPLAGGQEGTATTPTANIATFTDPAGFGKETASGDFTATINWGDGTSSAAQVAATATPGVYQINDTTGHVYVEDGSYQVTIRIQHDGLATLTSSAQTVTITDQPVATVTDAGTLPAGKLEGQTLGSITGIATFSDPAGQGKENAGDFSATILWGDGTSGPGTVVMLGGGNYQVNAPSHTYAEDGTYTIQVQVSHDGTAPATSTGRNITIGEAPISTPVVAAVSAKEATPTGTITGLATFTDSAGVVAAGDSFTATINWGDTSPVDTNATVVSLGGGHYRVDATAGHTYADNGTYTVTVSVTHDSLAAVAGTGTARVADVAVAATGGFTITETEGDPTPALQEVATFTDPAGAEAVSDYSALIHWGDGLVSPGVITSTGGNGFMVQGSHTYAEESASNHLGSNPYTITVVVSHEATAAQTVISHATVGEVNVSAVGGMSYTTQVGTSTGVVTLATFTDPGGSEPITDYHATINWGDGSAATTGSIVNIGGVYEVQGAHTYSKESLPANTGGTNAFFTVTVTISHETSTPQTVTSKVVVGPRIGLSGAATIPEGQTAYLVTVTPATDSGTYKFNWNDGSSPTGTGLFAPSTTLTTAQLAATGNRLSHVFFDAGAFTVTVDFTPASNPTVTFTGIATLPVTVTDVNPQGVVISAPTSGPISLPNYPNGSITFTASLPTGPAPADKAAGWTYAWQLLDSNKKPITTNPQYSQTFTSVTTTAQTTFKFNNPGIGSYFVELTVTALDGDKTTVTRSLTVSSTSTSTGGGIVR